MAWGNNWQEIGSLKQNFSECPIWSWKKGAIVLAWTVHVDVLNLSKNLHHLGGNRNNIFNETGLHTLRSSLFHLRFFCGSYRQRSIGYNLISAILISWARMGLRYICERGFMHSFVRKEMDWKTKRTIVHATQICEPIFPQLSLKEERKKLNGRILEQRGKWFLKNVLVLFRITKIRQRD